MARIKGKQTLANTVSVTQSQFLGHSFLHGSFN